MDETGKKMKNKLSILILLGCASLSIAHVGSLNVFYEGKAGTYPIRVIIRPPGVVPGLAEITVRSLGKGVERVTVQPVKWDAGPEGAPPPDVAVNVSGDGTLFSSELWLMDFGSYSVNVDVHGEQGHGRSIVPVSSIATRKLEMSPALKGILIFLMIFLFSGGITIIGAAVRESTLELGSKTSKERKRKSRVSMLVGALIFIGLLYGGRMWWTSIDNEYQENLFKPIEVTSEVISMNDTRILQVSITDEKWIKDLYPPLIPDHGKIMHTYFMRIPGLDAFSHIHPVAIDQDQNTFQVIVPPLPGGDFVLFADITHESGFAQTLIDTVTVPEYSGVEFLEDLHIDRDPDDSWKMGYPLPDLDLDSPVRSSDLVNGKFLMEWLNLPDRIIAEKEVELSFKVTDITRGHLSLEPYMGMLSHAGILRTDGSVFLHLHPIGSISMASQQRFEQQSGINARSGSMHDGHMDHSKHMGNEIIKSSESVSYPPIEFPRPGQYRIWIQVKVSGEVLTGIFDLYVHPPIVS